MIGRAVPEWRGRTPNTPAPPRVRRRVFDHWGGRCHLTGVEINVGDVWELEHIKALSLGGLNVESNLAPALIEPHKAKTALDVKAKAKIARIRNKHLGIHKSGHRPINGSRRSDFKHRLDGKFGGRGSWERRPGNG
jgi:hypothetical protein